MARIKPPKFKEKDYLITKFGAVGDGKTLCLEAYKRAIGECAKSGKLLSSKKGDLIVVPRGTPRQSIAVKGKKFSLILIKIFAQPLPPKT